MTFQLFLACLESLQTCNILSEIDTEKLFSNITEILECNLNFWSTYIFPAVHRMRMCRKAISPVMFHDGFLHMGEIYHPYFRYCAEQARCQHYCKEMHAHNEVFTAYLVWCETQKECNRWVYETRLYLAYKVIFVYYKLLTYTW